VKTIWLAISIVESSSKLEMATSPVIPASVASRTAAKAPPIPETGVREATDARTHRGRIEIEGASSGQGTSIAATVADSVTDNNNTGILAASSAGFAPVTVMVRNDVISNNSAGIGVVSATLYLDHSALTGNTTALSNIGGTLASYGDNNIDGNIMFESSPTAVAFH
jgi:hypothetical protein